MSRFHFPGGGQSPEGPMRHPPGSPPLPGRANPIQTLVAVVVGLLVIYAGYWWFIRRVVVGPDEVMVLLKKNGHRTLPGDQIIIPRPPDSKSDPQGYAAWNSQYGDCNGILEQVMLPGTYFGFSPFDYQREVRKIGPADVPAGKIGIVVRKFGDRLPPGHVLADDQQPQRGPLGKVLWPGKYYEYANPYAYEIKLVTPISVDPGYRGVVTRVAGTPAANPNDYLVQAGEQGTQRQAQPEGFVYYNPYAERITSISIQSQRFEMTGNDAIQFPSADSFDIRMEGFVEWAVVPDKLPLIYVQYGEGGELIPFLEEVVILPYSRSFSRLVGSQYTAREFISGDTKLKFQAEFEQKLKDACKAQGIEILQALVRDIVPPNDIKNPINEREIAKQQIRSLEQQIQVAHSQAQLATQTEMANQNQAIGESNKQVVTIIKKAEQDRDVAITQANQELAVAKLRLEAAQKQADAMIQTGQAEAAVILLNKQAEAEPLAQQVQAFGDGATYAQFFYFQNVAPAVKSILANTDGPFADLFMQFASPHAARSPGTQAQDKATGVQP